jgi:hypothetical protein
MPPPHAIREHAECPLDWAGAVHVCLQLSQDSPFFFEIAALDAFASCGSGSGSGAALFSPLLSHVAFSGIWLVNLRATYLCHLPCCIIT